MPLPPALAARLAKRGIISKKSAQQQSGLFKVETKLLKNICFLIPKKLQLGIKKKKFLLKITMTMRKPVFGGLP
jgi:hypothetical protein